MPSWQPAWWDLFGPEEEEPEEAPLPAVAPQVDALAEIPPLGPTDQQPYKPKKWKPVEMDWYKLTTRVSKSAMAQLFKYWHEGIEPSAEARSELLGAGLDWYWGFQYGGPPDQRWDEYQEDLKKMYDNAIRQAGYGIPRVYVPGLSREVAYTGMGPWYNYNRYRRY